MKIVQVQTSMRSAGRSCLRLHNIFLERGIDSTIISLHSDKILGKNFFYLTSKSKTLLRINRKIEEKQNRKNDQTWGTFSYPILGTNITNLPEIKSADVIYLHWILDGFLNFSNLKAIFNLNKPVIIFMHDMWWITGGCHHSFECNKYQSHCFNCPMLFGNKKYDRSYKGFEKKARLYIAYNNLHFVSPSNWLLNCAKKSHLSESKPLHYIPNILDDKVFKPLNKGFSRKTLNLPEDKIVICFGAESINNPYKGWNFLKEALLILFNKGLKNISVLIFGSTDNEAQASFPFPTEMVGYLNDEFSLSLVYNSADIFVAPSLAETFGYVILEALSCGIPVVAFNIGGIPDLVLHKSNGYLAKPMDSQDLANGIEYCIEHRIKGKRLTDFEKDKVINKHIELIDSLLGSD